MATSHAKHMCLDVPDSSDSVESSDATEHFCLTYHAAPPCIEAVVSDIVTQYNLDSTFYILDLAVLRQLFAEWTNAMPRVQV